MKISVMQWHEVNVNEDFEVKSGIVHVRSSREVTVYVEQKGREVILGTGYEVRGEVRGQCGVRIEGSKTTRAFYYSVVTDIIHPDPEKEVFTNSDRVPIADDTPFEGSLRIRRLKEAIQTRQLMAERRIAERRKMERDEKIENDRISALEAQVVEEKNPAATPNDDKKTEDE